MTQNIRSFPARGSFSPEEVEAILGRAYAARDAVLARAICAGVRGLAGAFTRLRAVIDEANRLRSLAMLDDRRLAAMGVTRSDLPGIVYGWTAGASTTAARAAFDADEGVAPRLQDAA